MYDHYDHPARRLVSNLDECSVCGVAIEGEDADLRHVREPYRQKMLPARSDTPAFNRGVAVATQALDRLGWAPSLDNETRARAVIEAVYGAGLLTSRPRKVRARKVLAPPSRQTGKAPDGVPGLALP